MTIKTIAVGRPQTKGLPDASLTERAASLLGYAAIGATVTAISEARVLQKALHEMGIVVLHPKSVEAYKRDRVRDENEKSAARNQWNPARHGWTSIPLARYRKAVPTEAIRLAVAIAEAVPRATFFVEELQRRTQEPKTLDPFLYVKCGSVSYYIAHWDEPEFREI